MPTYSHCGFVGRYSRASPPPLQPTSMTRLACRGMSCNRSPLASRLIGVCSMASSSRGAHGEVTGIAGGIRALPAPGVCAHAIEVSFRFPSEQAVRERGVGKRNGDIAWPPLDHLVGYGPAAGLRE